MPRLKRRRTVAGQDIAVAILDDYQGVAESFADWRPVRARARLTIFHDHVAEPDDLVARLAPFEVVCVMRERTPLPRAILERLPRLKLIITTGAHNRSIDLAAAHERGISVCRAGPGSSGQMVEFTWGMILALARHIPFEDRAMRAGGWQTTVGTALFGKTLGVVGLGKIGAGVAKVGLAFGMNVIAWSANLTPARAAECGASRVEKDELLRQSDVVTLHLVLSARSRGIIGARELGLMKPSATIVNTSRGPLIEEAALIEALRHGRIAGAALDVYDREPLPADHPLRSLENTVLTPNLGYVSGETYSRYFKEMVEDVLAYLDGKPIRLVED
jgi:phosphoglycerate dehydrogenase-like enzyme